jgi:hypothetical protein
LEEGAPAQDGVATGQGCDGVPNLEIAAKVSEQGWASQFDDPDGAAITRELPWGEKSVI